MNYDVFDLLGNIGVALILVMYLSLQAERVTADALIYSVLNALGAGLILISLYSKFNLSAFIIEFFWLAISVFGIGKSLRKSVPGKL